MTEEVQQAESSASGSVCNSKLTSAEVQSTDTKPKVDNKKEKCKPMTKVVIRRLPPSMTQIQFVEQVSPLPDNDYLHFVKADTSLGQYAYSRAYINFLEQKDIFVFREKFDNYVFVDAKGTEYPAVVEFAPFQRLPKKRVGRKKDLKCGTIEADPYYIGFLESLKNLETDTGASQPKTEYSFQPFDNAQKRVTTTPLLEYLKQRKQEKQRVRDEKREERRRRDLERRRAKDEPTISKVLRNPDAEREPSRENKENKEEREKVPTKDTRSRKRDETKTREKVLVTRDRDAKGPSKSSKEDRKQDREKHQKKNEDKKSFNRRDDKDNTTKEERKHEAKTTKELKEDMKERKLDEKKGKSYEKTRQEKRRLAESKKQMANTGVQKEEPKNEGAVDKKIETKTEENNVVQKNIDKSDEDIEKMECDMTEKRVKDTGEANEDVDVEKSPDKFRFERNSIYFDTEEKNERSRIGKNAKIVKRRSSLESGGDLGGGDGALLRRHKSLDGGDDENLQKNDNDAKDKDKKETKSGRRIRNKDRPAMEIYRPGMGRFSKQRLEREKPTTDDRVFLSESPTPGAKSTTTITAAVPISSDDLKLAEVRSLVFKRSISRDN